VLVIAAGILVAHHLAGPLRHWRRVMAQLSMTGLMLALDAYGPVTTTRAAIAEMADLPEEVARVTDRSTRRQHHEGVTKGTRSARLRSLRSCCSTLTLGTDQAGRGTHSSSASTSRTRGSSPVSSFGG